MDEELKKSVLKTGTSIVGIVCKDGIVMAGDRKSTAGNIVMGKNVPKVEQVNDYLIAAWTGMASDAQFLKKIISAELKLKHLRSRTRPTVKEGANLIATISFRNIRQFSTIISIVGTLVAGYEEDGNFSLFTIEPAGSVMKVEDYDANFGSGMPFMLGVLERGYKKNMSVDEGIKLAIECLKASTQRDVGSGFGIDVFTVTKEGIKQVVKQEIESIYKEQK